MFDKADDRFSPKEKERPQATMATARHFYRPKFCPFPKSASPRSLERPTETRHGIFISRGGEPLINFIPDVDQSRGRY